MKASTRGAAARGASGDMAERVTKKTHGRNSEKGAQGERPKKSVDARAAEALQFAKKLAAKRLDGITIGNALFGAGGKLTQLFPDMRERAALAGSRAYNDLCDLLDQERDNKGDPPGELADRLSTASGQTIVRMPRTMHAALLAEAEAEGVSLNELCVSKLAVQLRSALTLAK